MKKLIAPLLLCVLLLCACTQGAEPPVQTKDVENSRTLVSTDTFTVEAVVDGENVKYRYTVFDLDGKTIESAFCAEMPKGSQVSEALAGIRFTDDGHSWARYYDLKNGKASESFMNAFWSDGELVAYNAYDNGHIMVVRSIFDESGYRFETPVESDSWQIFVTAAELSEDGTSLSVEFVDGDGTKPDAKVKTITLPLVPEE